VIEWLLLNASSASFVAIPWREQVNFQWDDDEVRWYYTNTLSLIYIVPVHWNKINSPWIDMSPHSNTIFWFRANHCLLFLFNAKYIPEKQQISNLIVFGLTRLGLEFLINCTRGYHAKHYTTDAVKRYRRYISDKIRFYS
jgi:hypothetical protein